MRKSKADIIREEAYQKGREDALNEVSREMPFASMDVGDYGKGFDDACKRFRQVAKLVKEKV